MQHDKTAACLPLKFEQVYFKVKVDTVRSLTQQLAGHKNGCQMFKFTALLRQKLKKKNPIKFVQKTLKSKNPKNLPFFPFDSSFTKMAFNR